MYGDASQWPYNSFIMDAKDTKGNFVQFVPKLKSEGGNYVTEFYVAASADGEKLHIEFDDKNISGLIPVINTGGYQIWKRITTKFNIPTGNHMMKIVFDEANLRMNFDKVVFTAE